MKITKIPGLGRFGVFIDDLDFSTMTDEEWLEVGKIHLESLVTIIRNVKVAPADYEQWMLKWGNHRVLQHYRILKKFNVPHVQHIVGKEVVNGVEVDEETIKWLRTSFNLMPSAEAGLKTQMLRISGLKNEKGEPLGMFAEGELLWHSNESGNICFAPGVSLLGHHGVVGSATGFLTTPDWYESQSESFRSELDEMVIEHRFTPGRINPGLRLDQDDLMYKNMCPVDMEIPLVIKSPNGIKGLHYSVNTIDSIKGMTKAESDKMFEYINKTLFVDEYIYDHWYQQDNDICLFDNSITLHRRLGGIADRLCYRIQYDYKKIAPAGYNPYYQEPYATQYSTEIAEVNTILGIK
jgi:hypothetical protein